MMVFGRQSRLRLPEVFEVALPGPRELVDAKLVEAMRLAELAAGVSACRLERVGAALLDSGLDSLGLGWTHTPGATAACAEAAACPGHTAGRSRAETRQYACVGVHAVPDALIKCGHSAEISHCVMTLSPCLQCVQWLLDTPCCYVWFRREVEHPGAGERWTAAGRHWLRWPAMEPLDA